MKNDRLIQEVKKLGYKEAEKNDLARASKVTVKSDRRCFKCNPLSYNWSCQYENIRKNRIYCRYD